MLSKVFESICILCKVIECIKRSGQLQLTYVSYYRFSCYCEKSQTCLCSSTTMMTWNHIKWFVGQRKWTMSFILRKVMFNKLLLPYFCLNTYRLCFVIFDNGNINSTFQGVLILSRYLMTEQTNNTMNVMIYHAWFIFGLVNKQWFSMEI